MQLIACAERKPLRHRLKDGTYIIEFKTAAGQALAISVPSGETAVLEHFRVRMPHGLFVPDVEAK